MSKHINAEFFQDGERDSFSASSDDADGFDAHDAIDALIQRCGGDGFAGHVWVDGKCVLSTENAPSTGWPVGSSAARSVREYYERRVAAAAPSYPDRPEGLENQATAAVRLVADAYRRAIAINAEATRRAVAVESEALARLRKAIADEEAQLARRRSSVEEERAAVIRSNELFQAHVTSLNAKVAQDRVALPKIFGRTLPTTTERTAPKAKEPISGVNRVKKTIDSLIALGGQVHAEGWNEPT